MKLKSFLWTLGFKPRARVYDHEVRSFALPRDGHIEYAKWMHPKDYVHEFSQAFVDQLRRFISPGDFAIDIGAHTGDFTLPIALAAGAEGCVLAVEPNPYVFECLQTTASLNGDKTNIKTLCAAASETEGPIEFRYSDPGYCNGGHLESISRWKHGHPFLLTVPGVILTDWLAENMPEQIEKLSFLKIDAEGYDLQVLNSLIPIVRKQHPYMHIEMYRHLTTEKRLELLDLLIELEYRPLIVTDESDWMNGIELKEDRLHFQPHFDLFCIPL